MPFREFLEHLEPLRPDRPDRRESFADTPDAPDAAEAAEADLAERVPADAPPCEREQLRRADDAPPDPTCPLPADIPDIPDLREPDRADWVADATSPFPAADPAWPFPPADMLADLFDAHERLPERLADPA